MTDNDRQEANRRTLKKTLFIAVGMLGFAYALIPLYSLVCDITGLNGKTGRLEKEKALAAKPDKARTITVLFDGTLNASMPWEFHPVQVKMEVHPGEVAKADYFVKNLTEHDMVGQAVPSVSPSKAAKYFSKTECFCFSNQKLKAKEAKEMPIRYIIDPALPEDIKTITLSYTFFDVTKNVTTAKN